MTTVHERARALIWGRQLLEDVIAHPTMAASHLDQAARLLRGYPEPDAIANRLNALSGVELLSAVQQFVGTRQLLLQLRFSSAMSADWVERATRVERHFPEARDLTDGIEWASMFLGRGKADPIAVEDGLPYLVALKRKDAEDIAAGRRTARGLHIVRSGDLKGVVFTPGLASGYDVPGECWDNPSRPKGSQLTVLERQVQAAGWLDEDGFWSGPPDYAELRELAADVLGSRANADAWLEEPALGLAGQRPMDLIDTADGCQQVGIFLARMRAGVYC